MIYHGTARINGSEHKIQVNALHVSGDVVSEIGMYLMEIPDPKSPHREEFWFKIKSSHPQAPEISDIQVCIEGELRTLRFESGQKV